MKDRTGALLADDMGLGKTLQAIGLMGMHMWKMRNEFKRSDECKFLVIVPATLRDNWSDELDKFSRFYFELLSGGPTARSKQLSAFAQRTDTCILVCNYEQLSPHVAEINQVGFSMKILDEAHKIKNPKSQRYKALKQLRTQRSFCLTGTPMTKHVDDLWAILDTIEPGQWGTYWQFTHKYCVYGGFGGKQIVGVKNMHVLTEKLNRVMLRRMKADVLDLPEVQYIDRLVTMTPRQRAIYNKIAKDRELDREDGADPEYIEYDTVKMIRLRQICATTATLVASGEDTSSKLDLAIDDAVEIIENGHKLVVFTQFRKVIDCYIERMRTKHPNVPIFEIHGDIATNARQGVVKKWAEVEGPAICIGIISVMGTGLNMTAASRCQFVDEMYSPAENRQAVDRLNRIGADKTQPVQVFRYMVRGSAEYSVRRIIEGKNKVNDDIINNTDADFEERVRQAMKETL